MKSGTLSLVKWVVYLIARWVVLDDRRGGSFSLVVDSKSFLATSYKIIAMIYKNQGNLPLALVNAEKAFELDQKLFGNESPQVSIDYNNIEIICETQKNLGLAEKSSSVLLS